MTLKPEDLRAYANRDWKALAAVKEEFARTRRETLGLAGALHTTSALRDWACLVQPAFSSPDQRRADLAAHAQLAEMLARVRPD